MIRYIRPWSLLAAVAAVLVLAGCSSKPSASPGPSPAPISKGVPETAPGAEATHSDSAEQVVPAGTVSEIWSQISAEQDKLTAAIQNGQLAEVHHDAFGIRDLVIALAGKAKAESPVTAPQLDQLVEQVKSSATRLDALGDAGNVSGTQAEFAKLNTILIAINGVARGK